MLCSEGIVDLTTTAQAITPHPPLHMQERLLRHPDGGVNVNLNLNNLTLDVVQGHSRKSSVNTTTTTNSNATYGLLDYYTEDNDHEQDNENENGHDHNHNHNQDNETPSLLAMRPHSPSKASHLRQEVHIDEEVDKPQPQPQPQDHINEHEQELQRKLQLQSSREDLNALREAISESISLSVPHNGGFVNFRRSKTKSKSTIMTKARTKPKAKDLKKFRNALHDRYGFKKTSPYVSTDDYNEWWDEYAPYTLRRSGKWIKFLEKMGCFVDPQIGDGIPKAFPVKSAEMAKFVKKGIPAEWRGAAWFSFVGGEELLKEHRGLYDALVDQVWDLKNENSEAIEKDLHRTFPENIYFTNNQPTDIHQTDDDTNTERDIESPILTALRRVLRCFSLYKPTIGYCQSLNFIAGLMLLFMEEEKAFWMLVIVTERFLPGVHESSLEGLAVNQGMLLLCLKRHLPEVWKIIMDNDMESSMDLSGTDPSTEEDDTSYLFFLPTLTFCTTSWFMSLFIGVLPIETTLRIWDIIFYESSKTIFQVSLGIFKMLDPELRKCYCRAHGLSISNATSVVSQLARHSDSDLITRLASNNKSNTSLTDAVTDNTSSYNREILSSELFQLIQNTPKRIVNVNLFIEECFRHDSSSFCNLSQQEIKRCRDFVIQSRERHATLIERRKELGMTPQERKELLKQERELSRISKVWDGNLDLDRAPGRGLRTAYWNAGLNRRIKKIYSKGPKE